MRRLLFAAALAPVLAFSACTSARVALPPEAPPPAAPAPPLVEAWKANVEAGGGPHALVPAGAYALVATRKGTLAVLDLTRGKLAGQTSFGASLDAPPLRRGDDVWVAVEKGRYGLVRYDAPRGEKTRSLLRRIGVRTSPLAVGDAVVVGTDGGEVVALDAETGAERWRAEAGGRGVTSLHLLGGRVVAVAEQGHVEAFHPTSGASQWQARVPPPSAGAALVGPRLVVPTARGRLVALDASTGGGGWTLALADTTVRFGEPVDAGENRLLVGATDRQVRLVDAGTGTVVWSVDAGAVVLAAPLVARDADGVPIAYVGTHGRRVLALRLSDGATVWEGRTGGRVKTAPVAAGSCLLVYAEPRHVHCFRPMEAADATGR